MNKNPGDLQECNMWHGSTSKRAMDNGVVTDPDKKDYVIFQSLISMILRKKARKQFYYCY